MTDVTHMLSRIQGGDSSAAEQLLPLVYAELRSLAAARMAHEKPGHTLQATALVHEAYMRLVDAEEVRHWNSRGHFFGAAAEAMRRILVDNARRKQTLKSGGQRERQPLDEAETAGPAATEQQVAISDVLDQLADHAPEVADLVKLRVYVGLTVHEAAQALGVSRTTAFRLWTYARAWLRAKLADDESVERNVGDER